MATLSGYILEVRRLLHDANGNFYSDQELTDYINEARKRLVRDTGCLRVLQVFQTPSSPPGSLSQPIPWTANTPITAGQFLFSNIFTYEVTTSGTTGAQPPPYPQAGINSFPPSTPFANGSALLQYVQNVEIIQYGSLPSGISTLDVLNINLYWGNTRVPLRYFPWTQFNSQLRIWQNYIGRPLAFSIYGQQTIYISPTPDQVYAIELDTVVLPDALVDPTDVDPINDPYTTPVSFYAAYKAKFKEQSFGESEIFRQDYVRQAQAVLASVYTRRIPDPYSRPY